MASRKLDASRTIDGIDANNESIDRLSQLKQLYFTSFTNLQSAAFEKFPELTAYDCHAALEAVAALLPTYAGPLDDSESFERWGKRKAIEEASRYVFLHLAMGEYRKMILATIRATMWESAQDRSIEADDLFSDVLPLIFNMAPKFLRNKRAKLSTRLCALARRHVYFYYNSKNKKRLEAVTTHIERDGELRVEVMSDEELASERASLAGPDSYQSSGQFLT